MLYYHVSDYLGIEFTAGRFFPTTYVGLLGFVPFLLGVSKLYELIKERYFSDVTPNLNESQVTSLDGIRIAFYIIILYSIYRLILSGHI